MHFVANAARGEFGISYRNQQDVFALVAERFPATFELVMMATLLSLVIGVPLGVLAAAQPGTAAASSACSIAGTGATVAGVPARIAEARTK